MTEKDHSSQPPDSTPGKAIEVERIELTPQQRAGLTTNLDRLPGPEEISPQRHSVGLILLSPDKPSAESIIKAVEAIKARCAPEHASIIDQALADVLKNLESS
jgi:hypothetical protein